MNSKDKVKQLLETGWGVGMAMTGDDGKSHMFNPFKPKKEKLNKAEHYTNEWPFVVKEEEKKDDKNESKESIEE